MNSAKTKISNNFKKKYKTLPLFNDLKFKKKSLTCRFV